MPMGMITFFPMDVTDERLTTLPGAPAATHLYESVDTGPKTAFTSGLQVHFRVARTALGTQVDTDPASHPAAGNPAEEEAFAAWRAAQIDLLARQHPPLTPDVVERHGAAIRAAEADTGGLRETGRDGEEMCAGCAGDGELYNETCDICLGNGSVPVIASYAGTYRDAYGDTTIDISVIRTSGEQGAFVTLNSGATRTRLSDPDAQDAFDAWVQARCQEARQLAGT